MAFKGDELAHDAFVQPRQRHLILNRMLPVAQVAREEPEIVGALAGRVKADGHHPVAAALVRRQHHPLPPVIRPGRQSLPGKHGAASQVVLGRALRLPILAEVEPEARVVRGRRGHVQPAHAAAHQPVAQGRGRARLRRKIRRRDECRLFQLIGGERKVFLDEHDVLAGNDPHPHLIELPVIELVPDCRLREHRPVGINMDRERADGPVSQQAAFSKPTTRQSFHGLDRCRQLRERRARLETGGDGDPHRSSASRQNQRRSFVRPRSGIAVALRRLRLITQCEVVRPVWSKIDEKRQTPFRFSIGLCPPVELEWQRLARLVHDRILRFTTRYGGCVFDRKEDKLIGPAVAEAVLDVPRLRLLGDDGRNSDEQCRNTSRQRVPDHHAPSVPPCIHSTREACLETFRLSCARATSTFAVNARRLVHPVFH